MGCIGCIEFSLQKQTNKNRRSAYVCGAYLQRSLFPTVAVEFVGSAVRFFLRKRYENQYLERISLNHNRVMPH